MRRDRGCQVPTGSGGEVDLAHQPDHRRSDSKSIKRNYLTTQYAVRSGRAAREIDETNPTSRLGDRHDPPRRLNPRNRRDPPDTGRGDVEPVESRAAREIDETNPASRLGDRHDVVRKEHEPSLPTLRPLRPYLPARHGESTKRVQPAGPSREGGAARQIDETNPARRLHDRHDRP
jgi:hypothetical protein